MSKLREPGLGPIVGHTTEKSCRVWIRAGDPDDVGSALAENRRTLGVAAIVEKGGVAIPDAQVRVHYFRLHREFDRAGTINLGIDPGIVDVSTPLALDAGSDYRAILGTLTLDDPDDLEESMSSTDLSARLPDPSVWLPELRVLERKRVGKCEAKFRTFPITDSAVAG